VLVHHREPVFHVNGSFGAGLDAYLALDATGLACRDDLRFHGIPIGTEGHGALPGARDPDENVLRTGLHTLAAAGALDGVHMRKAVVSHTECVERTDSGAVAQADAGPLTQLRASRRYLGSTAGLDARIFSLERGLVVGPLAYENADLVDRTGREA